MHTGVIFLLIAIAHHAAPVSPALGQRGGGNRTVCPEAALHSNTIASDAMLLALVTHIDRRMNRVRLGTG